MDREKKLIMILIAAFCMFFFVGCETERMPLSATYYDGTADGSTNSVVRIMYAQEKMYDKKNMDTLIKSNVDNISFTITPEGKSPISVTIAKKDYWYSLTSLLSENGEIVFKPYKGAPSESYIIKSPQDVNLTFKTVVGDVNENVLANMETISKEFKLEVKKSKAD